MTNLDSQRVTQSLRTVVLPHSNRAVRELVPYDLRHVPGIDLAMRKLNKWRAEREPKTRTVSGTEAITGVSENLA